MSNKSISLRIPANNPFFISVSQLKSKTNKLLEALNEYKNQLIVTNKARPIAIILPINDTNLNFNFESILEDLKIGLKESTKESMFIYNIYINIINNILPNDTSIEVTNNNGGKNGSTHEIETKAEAILEHFNKTFKTVKPFKNIDHVVKALVGTKRVKPKPYEEFFKIIDNINANEYKREYLRGSGHLTPETLFRDTHWESYLNMVSIKHDPYADLDKK